MSPRSTFGLETTATDVAAALGAQIQGRHVVVTGVSPASIGYSTVTAIASQRPASLVLASRTHAKLDAVAADLARLYKAVPVHKVLLDLSSVASVREAAAAITAAAPHGIDVLINNAGMVSQERRPRTTPGGTVVDVQMFTNHLGVFLLTALLLPALQKAAETASASSEPESTRVVNVSSIAHRLSPVRFSDYAFLRPDLELPLEEQPPRDLSPSFAGRADGYPGFLAYGQSKTANILHATELARRLRAASTTGRIMAFSAHPGTIATELSRSLNPDGIKAVNQSAPKGFWKTQDQGAATTLVAAFDPAVSTADVGGAAIGFLSDCQLRDDLVEAHARGTALAKRLWEESERMLQIKVDI